MEVRCQLLCFEAFIFLINGKVLAICIQRTFTVKKAIFVEIQDRPVATSSFLSDVSSLGVQGRFPFLFNYLKIKSEN